MCDLKIQSMLRHVETANEIADLVPFLKFFGITSLRSYVIENIDNLSSVQNKSKMGSTNSTSGCYHECLPLTTILDENVCQKILSFVESFTYSNVCKLFQKLSTMNDNQFCKQILKNDSDSGYQIHDQLQQIQHEKYLSRLKYVQLQEINFRLNQSYESCYSQTLSIQAKMEHVTRQIELLQEKLQSYHIQERALQLAIQKQKQKYSISDQRSTEKDSRQRKSVFGIIPPFVTATKDNPDTKVDTFIVDSTRKQLTAKEKNLGYKGPFSHPMSAVKFAVNNNNNNNKDYNFYGQIIRILVFPGVYDAILGDDVDLSLEMDSSFKFKFNDINDNSSTRVRIQLLGVAVGKSDDVIINSNGALSPLSSLSSVVFRSSLTDIDTFLEVNNCDLYLKNIEIDTSNIITTFDECIDYSGKNGKLWLDNCIIKFASVNGITINPGTCLYVNDCHFFGGYNSGTAIQLSSFSSEVFIENSTFYHCGNGSQFHERGYKPCVEIVGDSGRSGRVDEFSTAILIKCFGNTFVDNYGYPFGIEYSMTDYFSFLPHCALKQNQLKGFNGLGLGTHTKVNPNSLYRLQKL